MSLWHLTSLLRLSSDVQQLNVVADRQQSLTAYVSNESMVYGTMLVTPEAHLLHTAKVDFPDRLIAAVQWCKSGMCNRCAQVLKMRFSAV